MERRVSAITRMTSSGSPPVQVTHSISDEVEHTGRQVPGQWNLPGADELLGRLVVRARTVLHAGTSMGCWPRPRAGSNRRRGHLT
jgi:hypothetical protein